mmetsp:Transcript_5327/g.11721  ORF Transcript_5327/g.11721 Transcript_5327/m.11721 type:complete len:102 (-) Transcript_5327:113-418(-)
MFSWNRGIEPPPFTLENTAGMQLLKGIVDGLIAIPLVVPITQAVVIQIHALCFDLSATTILIGYGLSGYGDLYTILASLAVGAVVKETAAATSRLRIALTC